MLFILFSTAVAVFAPCLVQAESIERIFASHALALRQSALIGEDRFDDVVSQIPGAGIVDSGVLSSLLRLSFSNMIVKLGRLRSDAPVSLYYDPLLDIAILAFWKRDEEGYRVEFARALPGAWLESESREPSLLPPWMSGESALTALVRTTGERLDTFARMHPPDALVGGQGEVTFAQAATGMRAVIPRLFWNADLRVQWSDSSYQWLEPALEKVELVLSEADPQKMVLAAPETDAVTAEALAELPEQYISELVLDMVVGSPQNRLLVASSAGDGDTYVMVLCMINAADCRLRRFMLLSLID